MGSGREEDVLVPTLVDLKGCEARQVAVCEDRMVAFAPATIFKLEPDCGPVGGGTQVRVRGNGFFQTDRIRISLSFPLPATKGEEEEGGERKAREEVFLCRGVFDPSCGLIVFDTPRMSRTATCRVEVSMDDGNNFTSSSSSSSSFSCSRSRSRSRFPRIPELPVGVLPP
mmetsp:Transcript_16155/g.54111  ORF Transcript_16155/g.54111 Transcript_16155/m.54111 type:complete len:170 (-) Transcript_16155:699-1208(-)